MTSRRLYLFDDGRARRWAPFSLTRPIGELTFGCLTLRARAERTFGVKCEGHITRTALVGFDEAGSAPAVTLEHVRPDAVTILLSSRAVPDLAPAAVPDTSTRITIGALQPDGSSLLEVLPRPTSGFAILPPPQSRERPWP